MISQKIRDGKAGGAREAAWIDESLSPLEPRNTLRCHQARGRGAVPLVNHLQGCRS